MIGSSHPASLRLSDPSQHAPGPRDPTKILLHQKVPPPRSLSLARPLTRVPLSPRRSPHALAAYTRSPHALAARARRTRPSLFVSFTVRGRRLTTMLRPGLPSCRPTLHAHAAAPIHHPQCPRLDPLRQQPPHHTPRRLTALSSTPISPPSLEQGPGLSVTSSARSARDGAAPLTPVRTPS